MDKKESKDANIIIRVPSSLKQEIKDEAKIRETTVTELLLKGYSILKEGQYIDFK